MIIDRLENAANYAALHKNFTAGIAFIQRALAEDLAPGRYEIDGDEIFASVQEYDTFPSEGRVFEGHRKYIDLQFVMKGCERLEVIDITRATVSRPYDETIEAALYTPNAAAFGGILAEGDFALLFPHDLHRPGLRADEGVPVHTKKIVVKIGI